MKKNKSVASGKKDKNVWLSVRISQDEMRRLNREARKSGLNRSNHIRAQLFGSAEKQQDLEIDNQQNIICQNILNHLQEKYSCEDDSYLEEQVEKLWKLL